MFIMIQNILLPFRRNKHFPVLSGILLTVFICISVIFPAFAQTTTSTITGHISDGKEPVPDAVVTIVHELSGIPYYAIF